MTRIAHGAAALLLIALAAASLLGFAAGAPDSGGEIQAEAEGACKNVICMLAIN
ncbi:MAG: hypothetical protein AAFW81_08485 [Pseudomonadota bacterium]